LDSLFGISEKLATKTCLVSEYFSKGRKATPFLYQFFEKNLSTSMPCLRKSQRRIPKA
jgi:hypothetical protein